MTTEELFEITYNHGPDHVLFVPGRVNLIGDHIDYNGGCVLPTALDLGITVALGRRADNRVLVRSDGFDELTEFELGSQQKGAWADYANGAVSLANEAGIFDGGADIAITSTLPAGAGLSSSAALTVCILKIARHLSGATISDTDLAKLARRVEHEFIGVPCGIMDQMAVALANPGQAMALDTLSLDYQLIDIPCTHSIAIIHSGQHRSLADGRYKQRKEECDAAKGILRTHELCLLDAQDFNRIDELPSPVNLRVRHCVSEHRRAVLSVGALQQQDMRGVGDLMNASHVSMRDDFEMSLPEIDRLVETSINCGALGARLTGGGFGGCIVALLERERLDVWRQRVLHAHPKAFSVC